MIFDYLKRIAGSPRYERKYVVGNVSLSEINALIKSHPGGVREAFPERQVNNIYFDSEGLANYWENEAGIGRRVKSRLRWYGQLQGHIDNVNLELKVRENYLGYKVMYPLGQFELDKTTKGRWWLKLMKNKIPLLLAEYMQSMQPVLVNSYKRAYYATFDGNIRITVDREIQSFRQYSPNFFRFPGKHPLQGKPVLEIKYDPSVDEDVRDFIQFLPFRLSKNSKYIQGIESP